jgi:hypothetical protein
MKKNDDLNGKIIAIEFLSVFLAVISAFALNNYNENRRDANAEQKILTEIYNGLEKDLEDIALNEQGHQRGLRAVAYFAKAIRNEPVAADSALAYYHFLFRDFISLQNVAGYQTLKSKGLELIENDTLRQQIISLYEYDYTTLRKFEEEYAEMQYQANYFSPITRHMAPFFTLSEEGQLNGLAQPLQLEENAKKELLLYLGKIYLNRQFVIGFYKDVNQKIILLQQAIKAEIE